MSSAKVKVIKDDEGEVFVDVVDEDGERRVEVRVEADNSPSGAPEITAD